MEGNYKRSLAETYTAVKLHGEPPPRVILLFQTYTVENLHSRKLTRLGGCKFRAPLNLHTCEFTGTILYVECTHVSLDSNPLSKPKTNPKVTQR